MLESRFWGIFWIDASSYIAAQQGFREISRVCEIDEVPKAAKQWLSNTQNNWLLIIDNADDPAIDVSEFFPTGNRGTILLTTRNPDCKIHPTVGSCEFGQMDMGEAVTLLLKATGVEDVGDEAAKKKAIRVTQTLGFLALAIVQAGAYIRQGLCRIEEYCDVYNRHRQTLLKHRSAQMSSSYKHTVYTTWEISIEGIEKMYDETAHNAIELIRIFCFLHYEGISEEIFEQAWRNNLNKKRLPPGIAQTFYMQPQEKVEDWNPVIIREAAALLASFSLIKIDETERCMSMHPLVHVWARDRLSRKLQRYSWVTASFTLAATISWKNDLADFRFQRLLLPHIKSCINLCNDKPFINRFSKSDRVSVAAELALVLGGNGHLQEGMELEEKVLEASHRTLGSEHPDTLTAMSNLASSYSSLGHKQKATQLAERVLEAMQRTLGSEHPETFEAISRLAFTYNKVGCAKEAMELGEKVLEARQRTLRSEHPETLRAMTNLAVSYRNLGRIEEAMELDKKVLKARQKTLRSKNPDSSDAVCNPLKRKHDR